MCHVSASGFDLFNNYSLELLSYRTDRVEVLVYHIINNFAISYSAWSTYLPNSEKKTMIQCIVTSFFVFNFMC